MQFLFSSNIIMGIYQSIDINIFLKYNTTSAYDGGFLKSYDTNGSHCKIEKSTRSNF